MAWSSVQTLLPLDEWARLIGINSWEFNQFGAGLPSNTSFKQCADVWYQSTPQRNTLSRDEVAHAIASAEQKIANTLGAWPLPKYIEGERLNNTSYTLWRAGGCNVKIRPTWGLVTTIGKLTRVLVGNATVTYTDTDSDGLKETATATLATTITDPTQIGVYFATADRLTEFGEQWRLHGASVTLGSGTATIKMPAYMLGKPAKATPYRPEPLDAGDVNAYVTSVDVYHVYYDVWTSGAQGNAYTAPTDCATPPCPYTATPLKIINDLAGSGYLRASWEGNIGAPEYLLYNYVSGYQNDERLRYAIAYLAVSELTRGGCGCDRSTDIIQRLREDLTIQGANQFRPLTPMQLGTPFGTTRAGLEAWEIIYSMRAKGIVSI